MAFTISDFEDLERLLAEHPEWRVRLRPLILGEEILQLPERMTAVESRLDRIEAILERMAARQDALDQRMTQLDERMAQLAERVDALTEQMTELTRIATQHEEQFGRIDGRLNRIDGRMGNIEGQLLEAKYRDHMRDWLGAYLARIERISVDDLEGLRAAVKDGTLSPAEVARLRNADLMVRGLSRDGDAQDIVFVIEVSQTINTDDIQRAHEHALTLRRAGYNVRALVGGYRLAEGIEHRAEELGVLIDLRRAAA